MSSERPSPGQSRFAFVAGILALVVVLFGLEGYNLWRLRAVAIESQLGSATQYANAFEEHLTQTLSVVDISLVSLGDQALSGQVLQALTRNASYLRSVSVVDGKGNIEVSSEARNVGVAFRGDAFLPQSSGPLPLLRVGPLTQGRDLYEARAIAKGDDAPVQSFVAVQRDVPRAQGGFIKLVAVINPDYFLNYYGRNVDVEMADVELLGLDGGLILSTAQHFSPGSTGNTMVMGMVSKAESGRVRDDAQSGHERLTAYRVSKNFPILAVVHGDLAKGLRGWRKQALWDVALVLVMLALTLAMAAYYFLRIQRFAEERKTWARTLTNQKYALDQHAIVSITDSAGVITYANDSFCSISGYSSEELVGQFHRVVKSAHHPASFFEALWLTISQGQVWHGEICNRRKDGELYWVNATIVPLLGADGFVQQYIGIRTDITERKEIERSSEIAKNAAEQASLAKSQFLANMSHEIRTPMNAILGMLDLLQTTELTPRQRDYASKTQGAAQSLLGNLNDILDFSKVEAGKMTLESEPFYIDKLMRNLSVVLSATVAHKKIEVLFDIDPSLPQVLRGDAMRLEQVLINLGGNAVKFTPQGQVVLSLRKLAQTEHTVTIEFAVKDTGIGIAPEHQEHIFSGFSQAEGSTTRRFGGTGLGLAISRRFVQLMGGDIHLTSAQCVGSTFAFVLEMPTVDVTQTQAQAPSKPQSPPQRALVVDDNPIAAELTLRMVRSWGWTADLAKSGTQALQMIADTESSENAAFPYPVIYMDWKMPEMDGWEATRQIRELADRNKRPQPSIIMLTAHGWDMLLHSTEAEQEQINGFVVKPATASMLYDAWMDTQSGNAGIRKHTTGRSSTRQLTGMRILVVEDNLINQQVAEELLCSEGAIVSLAANGQLGVEAVAAAAPQFDVVLMDVQMPVLDGYGATRAIRQALNLQALPIIAMTANAMASDRDACLAAGMNEHIGKPFDIETLASLLIRMTRMTQPTAVKADLHAPSQTEPGHTQLPASKVLPVIEELDLQAALARMDGSTSLYAIVAQSFAKSLSTFTQEMQGLINSQDSKQIAIALHTLKGNAGTLGLSQLAQEAMRLELLCSTDDGLSRLRQELDALRVHLDRAVFLMEQAILLLNEGGSAFRSKQVASVSD